MKELLKEAFGSELEMPRMRWGESKLHPGAIAVYLVCETKHFAETGAFFYTMLSGRLFVGRRMPVLRCEHIPFEHEGKRCYYGEMVISVEKEADRLAILERLPTMAAQVELGTTSLSHMRHALSLGELRPEQKLALIRWDLSRIQKKYPREVGEGIYRELQQLLIATSEEFRSIRTSRHLTRMIGAFYIARRELQRTVRLFPKRRHLSIKLMHPHLAFAFGSKRVLGVAISLTCNRRTEWLEEKDILKAIQTIIPDVDVVEGSFVAYQEWQDPIRMLYLEVDRQDLFTSEEVARLRRELPSQLKGCIERLTHSLFYSRNEEEVMRYILSLSKEVQSGDDIPQMVASFQAQRDQTLSYSIIMVRPTREGDFPVASRFRELPVGVSCRIDTEQVVGQVDLTHEKVANVLTLTIPKEPFLRQDSAIDLLKARQYVVDLLQKIFGDVRDYNGGLMIKQNEVLDQTRTLLNRQERSQEHLLESLFYSISPVVMQSHLEPKIVRAFFRLLLETLRLEFRGGQRYAVRAVRRFGCEFLFVRSEDRSFKDEVEQAVKGLKLESIKLASAFLTIHGASYLGYICFGACRELRKEVHQALEEWERIRRSRQTLRLNLPRTFTSLDPRIGGDRRSGILTQMLYEGLVKLGDDHKPELAVAEKINISDDHKTYIFTLKECYWSNGAPVTARDFEYAWKQLLAPKFQSRFVPILFHPIRNAMAAKKGRCSIDDVGIYVRDEKTLIIELEGPNPYFLDLLTHWVFSPLYHEIDRVSPGWSHSRGDGYICNGPFKLSPSKVEEELRLVKNPAYWDSAAVRLQRIKICSILDPKTAWAMFEEGELDWLGDPLSELPAEQIPILKNKGRIQSKPSQAIHWMWMNVEQYPFNSQKMREAFAYAVDRVSLIANALDGYGQPAHNVIPPGMRHASSPKFPQCDRVLAKRLFQEALDELGITKEELPPLIFCHYRLQEEESVARELASQWSELFGVQIVLESMPLIFYHRPTKIASGYHFSNATWYPFFDDAIVMLQPFRKSSQVFNLARWEDADFIRLLKESDRCLDPDRRTTLLHQMEDVLVNQLPIIPLCFLTYRYVHRPGLKQVAFSDFGIVNFKRAYIESGG